jgi:hypothetical protein
MITSTESSSSGTFSIVPFRNSTFSTPAGHIHPVGLPGRADPAGGEEDVDPSPGAQVEDRLALAKLGDRRRVAATQGGELGGVGKLVAIVDRVELGAEALSFAGVRDIGPTAAGPSRRIGWAAAGDLPLAHRLGGLGISLADRLADLVIRGQLLSHALSSSSALGIT